MFRFLKRSIVLRFPRMGFSIFALSLATAFVYCALAVQKIGTEDIENQLRTLGPNLFILPDDKTAFLSESQIRKIQAQLSDSASGHIETIPVLYQIGRVKGNPVVAAGVPMQKLKRVYPYVKVLWREDRKEPSAWVGEKAFKHLGFSKDRSFKITFNAFAVSLFPGAIFVTGEAEDSQIFVDMDVLQKAPGLEGKYSLLAVSIPASAMDVVNALQKQANIQVKLLTAVTSGQQAFAKKVSSFLWVVAGILLLLSGCSLLATFLSLFLERLSEVALMKTLGAKKKELMLMFLLESALTGVFSGIIGIIVGIQCFNLIASQLFSGHVSSISFTAMIPALLSFSSAVCVALTASFIPLRASLEVPASVVLKGE